MLDSLLSQEDTAFSTPTGQAMPTGLGLFLPSEPGSEGQDTVTVFLLVWVSLRVRRPVLVERPLRPGAEAAGGSLRAIGRWERGAVGTVGLGALGAQRLSRC